jgi:serine/threonine protein kinase
MTTAAAAAETRFGRFLATRVLGSGGEGTVYLATDTQLGRQVAVKTVKRAGAGRPRGPGITGVETLLDEARIVCTLSHPNIVPLYDAGEQNGLPYLVFEYVEGRTLAALIAEHGRLDVDRAVNIAIALAGGVAYAHEHGIVHRDIKPANIMITPAGVARLMDFGIARHVAPAADGRLPIVGTPSYLAPEAIARRQFLPASDVFALGVVLYEMLAGEPPICGSGARETARRIVEEAFVPLLRHNPNVDERLNSLVMQALAKDVEQRFAGAADLATALREYLDPQPAPEIEANTQGTLEYLLRRIRHKGDFPALASTISAVNRAAVSDREPVAVLCNAILKDFALTSRLLKMVNASHMAQFGGSVGTVSRAVSLLGFDAVRNVSMSLLLFEHMHDRANAAALKNQVVATYFSGVLARELYDHAGLQDGEQAFISAMFHRLGKLLATFYLHEEALLIERQMQSRGWSEQQAAQTVLGIGFEELGVGVARSWNFPEELIDSMRLLGDAPRRLPAQQSEKLRLIASLSNDLAEVVLSDDESRRKERLAALVGRYGAATGLGEQALVAAVQSSAQKLARDAETLGHGVARSGFLSAALSWGAAADKKKAAPGVDGAAPAPASGSRPGANQGTQAAGPGTGDGALEWESGDLQDIAHTRQLSTDAQLDSAGGLAGEAPAKPGQRHAALAAGVQDITNALVGEPSLHDVLRIILETMYRAIGFQRVLLFVLDARMQALRCRFGFGADIDRIVQSGVAAPLQGPRDLFYAAVTMGADLCIDDLSSDKVRQHVPAWYRDAIGARGIVLLPIVNKKRTIGLIYADSDAPATLRFNAEELGLLKTLRNQALLAMRQLS